MSELIWEIFTRYDITRRKKYDRYKDLMHKLQHGTIYQDVDYRLIAYYFVRFRDRIYVFDDSELNNFILREFHLNTYSGYPKYQKTLKTMNKF